MQNVFLLSVMFLCYLVNTEATKKCPHNSKYMTCMDLCPKICNAPKETGCSNACIPGCSCFPGYELNYEGKCVKPKFCPPKPIDCPKNAQYVKCRNNCPKICNVPKPACFRHNCEPGCSCLPGFEINNKGECVEPMYCNRPECPEGSQYQACVDTCPKQCNKPRPSTCSLVCLPGCSCLPGYEINSHGKCVPPNQCEPPTDLPGNNGIVANITVQVIGSDVQEHSHLLVNGSGVLVEHIVLPG